LVEIKILEENAKNYDELELMRANIDNENSKLIVENDLLKS